MADLILTGVAEGPCGCCGPQCQFPIFSDWDQNFVGSSPWANGTDAAAAVSGSNFSIGFGDVGRVVDCLSLFISTDPTHSTFAPSFSSGLLTLVANFSATNSDSTLSIWTGLQLGAGTLSGHIDLTSSHPSGFTGMTVRVDLKLASDGSNVASFVSSFISSYPFSADFTLTVPDDDLYYLQVARPAFPFGDPASSLNLTATISNDGDISVCKAAAPYTSGMDTLFVDCT